MWSKIDVFIFTLTIAMVTAMPSKQDDKNEASVNSEPIPLSIVDPCRPNPCSANVVSTEKNSVAICSCSPDFIGIPHEGCRPECVLNTDCPSHSACIRNRCEDPCVDTCGRNAECQVINHIPMCLCSTQYTGNPFISCTPIQDACLNNTECSAGLACVRQKCVDPCIGTCGENAACEVLNHAPICSCPVGRIGDPLVKCTTAVEEEVLINPCAPSPCGSNSECRSMNGQAVCSCLPTYFGSPPRCRDGCVLNLDCSSNSACIDQKCVDPCHGSCGHNATCNVLNHTPICSCPSGMSGDPFVACNIDDMPCLNETECLAGLVCVNKKCVDPCIGACGENAACKVSNRTPICQCPHGIPIGDPFVKCITVEEEALTSPCIPSPCGPNSQCRSINGKPVCSCLPTYLGTPPNCRPECVVSSDCPSVSACLNQKCVDPCPGSCGVSATCNVLNHNSICSCPSGMTGDPFVACKTYETLIFSEPFANEYECFKNADCDAKFACIDQQCKDPCSEGLCGRNTECRVVKHIAVCLCLEALLDDPNGPCYYVTADPDIPENKRDKTSVQ